MSLLAAAMWLGCLAVFILWFVDGSDLVYLQWSYSVITAVLCVLSAILYLVIAIVSCCCCRGRPAQHVVYTTQAAAPVYAAPAAAELKADNVQAV